MIRLEKLEMQNFKSFAKKTLITFPTNFSVVCGPNGSGKSNILDAICFALGRISAKSLRADRMLEMIFHGSKGKKSADFSKVSLYFDNSDRKLPIDDDKVFISRRINKKGISIYKLNGRTVTREKIQEVLRSGHIRPDGHNIILQGDVTAVIEMGPLERREILDEMEGGGLSLSFSFMDEDEVKQLSKVLYDYMKERDGIETTYVCGPDSSPNLGGRGANGGIINGITYSYNDSGSYTISVNEGPWLIGGLTEVSGGVYMKQVEENSAQGTIIQDAGNHIEYKVRIDGFGERWAINCVAAVLRVGDKVSCTVHNNPVED